MNTNTNTNTSGDDGGGGDGGAFEVLPYDLGHSWFTEMDYNTGLALDKKKDPRLLSSLRRA
eukprot:CAMPEP_0204639448 /NCGR_PEP_ID=MMETSP0717-20131115/42907_1 /ASSEMBLY_ACC=CAM_ASM_000666 /TAXON_ID=230516 /ORGANISM="Chaetoceros curvisetus" /LENGTH=60 /DNA_ID=CAMNT_0051659539 /DNA_START=1 /DNA_END=179 /DNA_ORIENTATION=+